MKDREEVLLHESRAELRTLVDKNNNPLPGLEKVVHFEDVAGNVIIYPWNVLKESVLGWIEIEKGEHRGKQAVFDGAGISIEDDEGGPNV